jgi:hypothetical protein
LISILSVISGSARRTDRFGSSCTSSQDWIYALNEFKLCSGQALIITNTTDQCTSDAASSRFSVLNPFPASRKDPCLNVSDFNGTHICTHGYENVLSEDGEVSRNTLYTAVAPMYMEIRYTTEYSRLTALRVEDVPVIVARYRLNLDLTRVPMRSMLERTGTSNLWMTPGLKPLMSLWQGAE